MVYKVTNKMAPQNGNSSCDFFALESKVSVCFFIFQYQNEHMICIFLRRFI